MMRRLPVGLAAVAAAFIAAVPVWFWDDLENVGAGGPTNLVLPILAFVFAWAFAIPILAVAPRPRREGLAAGGLVALLMFAEVARIVATLEGDGPMWPLVPILGLPFAALAVGLGSVAGALAARRQAPAATASDARLAGVACVVAGVVILAVSGLFFAPLAIVLVFPLALAGGLIWFGVRQLRQAPPAPPGPRDAP